MTEKNYFLISITIGNQIHCNKVSYTFSDSVYGFLRVNFTKFKLKRKKALNYKKNYSHEIN